MHVVSVLYSVSFIHLSILLPLAKDLNYHAFIINLFLAIKFTKFILPLRLSWILSALCNLMYKFYHQCTKSLKNACWDFNWSVLTVCVCGELTSTLNPSTWFVYVCMCVLFKFFQYCFIVPCVERSCISLGRFVLSIWFLRAIVNGVYFRFLFLLVRGIMKYNWFLISILSRDLAKLSYYFW